MATVTTKYDIRRYSKASAAYADAAAMVSRELAAIELASDGVDCRNATWIQAEQMAGLAMRLKELREQFA